MFDAEKEILGFPSWGSDEFWIALELCDNIEGGHLCWERAHGSVSYSVEDPGSKVKLWRFSNRKQAKEQRRVVPLASLSQGSYSPLSSRWSPDSGMLSVSESSSLPRTRPQGGTN